MGVHFIDMVNDLNACKKCILNVCNKACGKYTTIFLHYSIPNISQTLHYAQFHSFYAASSIIIPYLQFKLPIKVSYLSYLTLAEPLKKYVIISLSIVFYCLS